MPDGDDCRRSHRFEHSQLDRIIKIGLRLIYAPLHFLGFGLIFHFVNPGDSRRLFRRFTFRLTG